MRRVVVRYSPRSTYGQLYDAHVNPIRRHFDGSIKYDGTPNLKPSKEHFIFGLGIHSAATVFMSHGLADKSWRDADRLEHMHHVFVSGPAWKEKLKRQGRAADTIHIVGYPYLDQALANEARNEYVLWAPTHHASPSSHPELDSPLHSAEEQGQLPFPLAVNLHPTLQTLGKGEPRSLAAGTLRGAAVVIADSGSTIYEAWALGIPVVFPDWIVAEKVKGEWPDSFEAQIYREQIGYHAHRSEQLLDSIREAATNGITPKEEAFIEGILPTALRGVSGMKAARTLEWLYDRGGEPCPEQR